MEMTPRQQWNQTLRWVDDNPDAYRALLLAAESISDERKPTPMRFLLEFLRYNGVFGKDLMHKLVDQLSGVEFADGEYKIPNAVAPGVARLIKRDMSGHDGFETHLSASKLDKVGVPIARL